MWSAFALLVYVVSTRVRRERRTPAAAVAWGMSLALLPYLALPLYLMFGQRKIRPVFSPHRPVPGESTHWAAVLLESFGLAPPAAARTRFHADGVEARDALWQLIDGAVERLDVCTYALGNDGCGREVLQRLTQRARSGVRVRLLLDGFGAWSAPWRELRALISAGGQVAVFRPLFGRRRPGPRNLRNHRKLSIADDTRLWAGGRNLADVYFGGHEGLEPWLDLSFDVSGAVATAAARQFEHDWAAVRGRPPEAINENRGSVSGGAAQFLPSGPDQREDTAQILLIDACFRAKHRVLAVTPYFVPDEGLLMAMRVAARRGVQLSIVLPAKSNHRIADFVRNRALRELARAGAEIRLVPGMVHAKAVVVDDTLALCGSINLDLRSLLLNYESAVVFYGADEIAWLAQWIDALAQRGKPFVPQSPGVLRDVAEGLLIAIAFQL